MVTLWASSGWKPTHLTSVFALRTSVLLLDGTMLMALIRMLNTDVCGCYIGWFHNLNRKKINQALERLAWKKGSGLFGLFIATENK
jgi:hypothetical protein